MSDRISRLAPGRVMTANREISITEAARLMKLTGIGSLVLTDDSGRPTGIVTDRDLVAKIGTNIDPREVAVATCASQTLITIEAGCEAADAIALMARHGVRRIPVVDEDGALTGMVTMDDLLIQLGDAEGGTLAELAEAIRAGARNEHPKPSAHESSL